MNLRGKFENIAEAYLGGVEPVGLRDCYVYQVVDKVGQSIRLAGWINSVRDLGGIAFVELRDRTGIVQLVLQGELLAEVKHINPEDVYLVEGVVVERAPEAVNPKLRTGHLEVKVRSMRKLSGASLLPFQLRAQASEELRLRYRYLDLRRDRYKYNLVVRSLIANSVRKYLIGKGFIEIETPMLIKTTPEGARDFLVPSRLQRGKFYALPQSPQLLKQILMIAGIDRYFQLARCLRDEDLRADRQPEFTQIDIEMSFVEMEDVLNLVENMFVEVLAEFGINLSRPFKRLSYDEAISKWDTDKPDLRYPFPIHDITELVRDSEFEVLRRAVADGKRVKCFKLPVKPSRKEYNLLLQEAKRECIVEHGFILSSLSQGKLTGAVGKYLNSEALVRLVGLDEGESVVILATDELGAVDRLKRFMINKLNLEPSSELEFLWITDFPLFQLEDGMIKPHHHPFSQPYPEQVELLESEPLKVRGKIYDLVLNGVELGSGSIRISDPELQLKVLEIIGVPRKEAEQKFGFLLEAFRYGVPPHGGIAIGFDRFIAILMDEPSIREVIAFPKTQQGSCLLTGAPSEPESQQLDELGLRVVLNDVN